MIWKQVIEENKELLPKPLIRQNFLIDSSHLIPDECFSSGRVVEIGSHFGGTTLRLALLSKKYKYKPVVAVDIWENNGTQQSKIEGMNKDGLNIFLKNMESHKVLENIEYYKRDSKELGLEWQEDVGFIIFDGSHYYDDVKKDMTIWKKFLIKDSIIIIDDFGPWGETKGPQGATDEIFLCDNNYTTIYHDNTFIVLKKEK